MTYFSPWLNVPQAVVLEARKDIELALGLTSEMPALLMVKANHLVARTVIPLEVNAGEEQWHVAFKTLEEAER